MRQRTPFNSHILKCWVCVVRQGNLVVEHRLALRRSDQIVLDLTLLLINTRCNQ